MKLEIKHIDPYLPYGLTFLMESEPNSKEPNIEELKSIDIVLKMVNFGWGNAKTFLEIKPILRPLSDFEKVAAKDLMVKFSTSLDVIQEVWRLIEEKDVKEVKFKAIQMMCENHIDFNNLIEKGLAIDINTLNDKL